MTLEAVPVRVRGDIVAGVAHRVGEVTIDEFADKVRRRLGEVLAGAQAGEWVRVYVTLSAPDEPARPERPEEI